MGVIQNSINTALGVGAVMARFYDQSKSQKALQISKKQQEVRQQQKMALAEKKLKIQEYEAKTRRGELNLKRKQFRTGEEEKPKEETIIIGGKKINLSSLGEDARKQLKEGNYV